jgi:cation diffusion facilitator family transporter
MEDAIPNATHEKSKAALSSVIAAVVLTSFKIVVGILTGSLGILAEAAHSGLDLVAALVTFFAVRISGRPADSDHTFGHGKVENLSALFETLLLLVTCVWIIYEAIQRLFYKPVEVEINIWAFLVMATSIVIDVTRSRMLYRAARKFNSQALEADALHFSTDIWSSSVVIVGLIGVKLSELVAGLSFLRQADAIAALVVAAIVVYVSIQLGVRAVQALLDSAPKDLTEKIKSVVENVPGVLNCHKLRIRTAGPQTFVELHIGVLAGQDITSVHALSNQVVSAVTSVIPDADVTVHADPVVPEISEQV